MRRDKRATISLSPLLFLFMLVSGHSWAEGLKDSIGEHFRGEVLKYDFGFWVFPRAGQGIVTFQGLGNGKYLGFHEGKTLGWVGWATRYRRDTYRSIMGTSPDGKRLIPLRFEEEVLIGEEVRRRITAYDYARGKALAETRRDGKVEREEIEIPADRPYEDPLTAFYNLRGGVYGKVEPGKTFLIATVPRGGKAKQIRMDIASREEAEKRRITEADKGKKDLLITVHMDRELVGSLQGGIEGWFSSDMVPISGIAKDVFFFADLFGKVTLHAFGGQPENLYSSASGPHRGRIERAGIK